MRKTIAILTLICMLFVLSPCGSAAAQTFSLSGDSATLGDIALRPDGAAGRLYENDGLTLFVPLEYDELLLTETPQDDESGLLFSVSERASVEAAKAADWDWDGAGWLFGIARVDEAARQELLCYDMSGRELFARDSDGQYYVFCHPTDVRYVREDNEAMARDQEQWSQLNEWAWSSVRESFLAENPGLVAVHFGNSELEMYLARLAYLPGMSYTVSTTQYGPLEPGEGFDAAPYLEPLMDGLTVEAFDGEVPDGEYTVLAFPEDDVRFDFFPAESGQELVRRVTGDGYEQLYRLSFEDETVRASEILQAWYDALAGGKTLGAAGKLLGGWTLAEDLTLTEAAQSAFDKATEGLLGVNYTPLALLGTQLVSGTNYCILCRAAVVYPGAEPYYAVVSVHEDLQGEAELLHIAPLDLAELSSGETP